MVSLPVEVMAAITSKVIETRLLSVLIVVYQEATMANTNSEHFMQECRKWRQYRKLSQLDLALSANISQRHLSYLETGRSSPSREMVIRLCEAMDIPLRERNFLLKSAGFTAIYTEYGFDDPSMSPVLEALQRMMNHHNPFPAVVVDRFWNVKMQNSATSALFSRLSHIPCIGQLIAQTEELNLASLTLHPQGLKPFISNWEEAAPQFIRRLISESNASGDPLVKQKISELLSLIEWQDGVEQSLENLVPVIPLKLSLGEWQLSMFSVISTFGTPQDITTDELRVETFYPSDKQTEEIFRTLLSN